MVLKPVYDQASLVRDAVKSVRDAMIIGAVLAVIILLLFLRHGRVTAISASSIPITMAITVFIMSLVGQTFNLMTLGAMAIAIGIVIDDAVVITENIVRHAHLQHDRAIAIRDAVQELIWPVTTSTITTVVVFLPLGLLTGVEGQFFKALSITLTIAVLVSLVVALTIIPLLSEQFLSIEDVEKAARRHRAPARRPRARRPRDRLARRPLRARARRRAAARALDHSDRDRARRRRRVRAARRRRPAFSRRSTKARSCSTTSAPAERRSPRPTGRCTSLSSILMSTPEITGTSRRTGRRARACSRRSRIAATSRSASSPRAIAAGRPKKSSPRCAARSRPAVPRLRVEFVQILSDVINDLAGAARPVEIKLFGLDLNALEAYAKTLEPKLVEGRRHRRLLQRRRASRAPRWT